MSGLRIALSRVRGWFSRRQGETRIDDEIATHLELLESDFHRRGLPPEEARLAARRAFGGATQIREEWRDGRSLPWLETFGRDVAYALRQLRRSPGFAAAAILTLALGIGANTAIYQVLYAVVFRPLPVADPQRLVEVTIVEKGKPQHFSYPLFREMAAHQDSLAGMFATSEFPLRDATLRGRGLARSIHGALVTGDYFRVLGVPAHAGRVFTMDDDRKSTPVAVISDRFWTSEFDRSPAALGQTLNINNVPVTIIGVAPAGFFGETLGLTPDVWAPMGLQPRLMPENYLDATYFTWLVAMGRLRPDVPPRQAQAALDALYRQHSGFTVTGPDQAHIELHPASRGIDTLRRFADPLYVLMATVGLVLLIASCNLANLLLSRATARRHEIGVRLAIGAGRARLVRQLLTESFVVSAIGAGLALAFAQWGSRSLVALAAQQIALPSGLPALGFTAAITVVVTCLFGIAPALAATRLDPHAALQAGGNRGSASPARHALGRSLVVAQVSISMLLVSTAGLMVRTLWNLRHQYFGFEQEGVLQITLPLELRNWRRAAAVAPTLSERLNALPGVRVAALSGFGPFSDMQHTGPFSAPDRPAQESDGSRMVHVSPDYFRTMVRVVAGRAFTPDDREGSPRVAVISETAARRLFGSESPLGRFISGAKQFDSQHQLLVVGVAHDVHYTPRDPYGFIVYVPLAQSPAPITDIHLRAAGNPARLTAAARAAIQEVAPWLRVGEIRLLSNTIEAGLTQERMMAWLSTAFGALALLLTFVGVYGVISYAVARRRQEIGIRMTLGARRGQIVRLVLNDTAWVVAGGLALGGGASMASFRFLRDLVFGVTNADSTVLLGLISIALVGLAAACIPAYRAARLDPTVALRQE